MNVKSLENDNKLKYRIMCILNIILIFGFIYSADAFLNPLQKNRLNVLNRNIIQSPIKVKYEATQQNTLKRFRDGSGKDWIALWNSWGTIHRLYADRISLAQRDKAKDDKDNIEDEIIEQANEFLREYADLFKVADNNLVLENTTYRGGIFYCQFWQFYKGVRVYGGGVQFRFDKNGNLLMIAGNTYPNINIHPFPIVSNNEAAGIARKNLGLSDGKGRVSEVEPFVLPLPCKEGLKYLLAWQVPLYMDSQTEGHLFFIDAYTGEIILTYQLNRYGIKGRIGGLILPKYFNDPPKWAPFDNQKVYLLNQFLPIREYNLDEDPGWAREGMWEFGVPVSQDINIYGHAGCPDPDKGLTGYNVFGYNLSGDYTNLMRPKYLTTDTIYCGNKTGVTLKFWRWLGVQREYWETDSGYRTDYDRATVEVSNDGGKTWTVIWSNGTSQVEDGTYDAFQGIWKGWKLRFFDISELVDGKEAVIRWGMGPTDGSGTFCGWNLDDIGIYESLDTITDPNGFFEFANTDDVPVNMVLCQLIGPYLEVINEDGASAINYLGGIEGDSQTVLALDWSTTHTPVEDFDEFNVFYHINLLLDYIKEIDPFFDAMDKKGPIKVIVRYGDNYMNAFWSPDNKICFGEGNSNTDGYRNFAHFSDIIYHEYAHAVTDSFYSFFMPPVTSIRKTTDSEQTGPVFVTEFDAMHEAFSDYWACTINEDSLIGEGDFWIKHKYVRNLDNKFKYPDDYGDDAYANSLILSGAMWETRELLGKEIADSLFHLARYGGATTFEDFLIDVLLQDEITYEGEHLNLIKDIFGQRGISRAPVPPSDLVGVAGDSFVELKWKENDEIDEIKGYFVYFRTENDIASDREDPSVRRDAGLTTSYRLDGLTNGTTYVIKVSAYNFYDAESEASDYVYATPYSESSQAALGAERKVLCFIRALKD